MREAVVQGAITNKRYWLLAVHLLNSLTQQAMNGGAGYGW